MSICSLYFSSCFRSFVPVSSSTKTSRQLSQWNHREGVSTLPRTKPKKCISSTFYAKPDFSIFPARKLESSRTLSTRTPNPNDSLQLHASELTDPSQLGHHPPLSVSPTLTLQTSRLSPSPTSLCQGMNLENPGGKQQSPVTKERCARSISISNTNIESVSSKQRSPYEIKHDILDQETLMDFTHHALRRISSMTFKESPHQRQTALSKNSFLSQRKVCLPKNKSSDKDNPKHPPRNTDITAVIHPNSNRKMHQELLQRGTTGTSTSLQGYEEITFLNVQRKFQTVSDGMPIQPSLNQHRHYTGNTQNRTAGFGPKDQTYERLCMTREAPPVSVSTECVLNQSTVLPNNESRRRHDPSETMSATFRSGSHIGIPLEENNIKSSSSSLQKTSASENIRTPQKHRIWPTNQSQKTHTDVRSTLLNQLVSASKGCECQSRGTDHEMESPQCEHRLNQSKTCLVAHGSQQVSGHASVKCTTSKTIYSQSDIKSGKHQLTHVQHPEENKSHSEVNQKAGVPTEVPECLSKKCAVYWSLSVEQSPFNTKCSGISSKGVFDRPLQSQHRVYQRPEETTTTASPPLHQTDYSPADRAFILEPEDPYYVTMYNPGLVYMGK